jgi:hypothetical protein
MPTVANYAIFTAQSYAFFATRQASACDDRDHRWPPCRYLVIVDSADRHHAQVTYARPGARRRSQVGMVSSHIPTIRRIAITLVGASDHEIRYLYRLSKVDRYTNQTCAIVVVSPVGAPRHAGRLTMQRRERPWLNTLSNHEDLDLGRGFDPRCLAARGAEGHCSLPGAI